MSTDYVLFVHGVSHRKIGEQPSYANKLFEFIENSVEPPLTVKKIALYWGDVNLEEERRLLKNFKASKAWDKLWFRKFRENYLLQFVGDAALYLSRHVGSQVVDRLKADAQEILGTAESPKFKPGDRLHLVGQSWGTIILFDILFADRWTKPNIPSHQNVMDIRKSLFGLPPSPETGIRLASIHTLGSPIALFNLISVNGSSHDFKPLLNKLLKNLYEVRCERLPWLNFIHQGDPLAWPLERVIFELVEGEAKYLDFEDLVTRKADLSDFLFAPVGHTLLALLHGGDAHGSYWRSEEVGQKIAQTIKEAAKVGNR